MLLYLPLLLQLAHHLSFVLAEECGPCPNVPKHYEELGCIAHKIHNTSCCSEYFDCPHLRPDRAANTGQCSFRGRVYALNEYLDADELRGDCRASCRCSRNRYATGNDDNEPTIECAQFSCADDQFDGVGSPIAAGCFVQNTLNECCALRVPLCGPEAERVSACYYDGSRYAPGSRFYPADAACYKCVCDGAWDNATRPDAGNRNCRRAECGTELHYAAQIRRGCVPVYFGENGCCPIQYRCPQRVDEALPFVGRVDSDARLVCTFNGLTLQIGQELQIDEDPCMRCSCRLPPMLHCVKEPGCRGSAKRKPQRLRP